MPQDLFSIEFGRIARTLEYKDAQRQLVFTFDFGSHDAKSLVLEHYAPQAQRVPRYRLAFERTTHFLERSGYRVEASGGFAAPLKLDASDVSALIEAELADAKKPGHLLPTARSHLLVPARSEFRLHPGNTVWDMWLVFEEPVHGIRIVFDEHSKQFGVAERDVFHGFYGTFVQSIDAISKAA